MTALDLGRAVVVSDEGVPFDLASHMQGRVSVVLVVCNHCPFVKHVADVLGAFGERWLPRGVAAVACNPNSETHPGDALALMAPVAAAAGWTFPYVADQQQSLVRALGAEVTPEAFVLDTAGVVRFRGRLDASTPGNGLEPSCDELDAAVEAVLGGESPSSHPPIGCSIKWIDTHPDKHSSAVDI